MILESCRSDPFLAPLIGLAAAWWACRVRHRPQWGGAQSPIKTAVAAYGQMSNRQRAKG